MNRQEVNNFNEIDKPPILYKYRNWENERHKTILTKGEVYLSPPKSFEDKDDCKIPIGYDLLSDEEIYNKYLSDSKNENLNFSRQQHRKYARDSFNKKLLRNKDWLTKNEEQHWEKFNKMFGVLSLTENSKNLKMWEKYSNNHSGICIGFDTSELQKFGGGGKVNYYPKLPKIHPFDDFEKKALTNIYSKKEEWAFEEEYRVHKLNPNSHNDDWRKVIIEPLAIKEIIIGARIEKSERDEIIEISKRLYPQAKIFLVSFNDKNLIFNLI